ncbi:hypothetical protein LCGC14_1591740 [marine sediment metagenome]|uniref:3'-phosphate/5'-hydroxy nucleic acid ligase n=1 Tax=marine sediment metagenome TaxID=412755 RepID=A0A0F9IDP5_9ZZZZ
MIKLQGQYNEALVMTDYPDETTIAQIILLLNQPWIKGSLVRIMADAHAGKGCVVGYTQTLNGTVVPNLVGVDIGCGIYSYKLFHKDTRKIDFQKLDDHIRANIPSGMSVRTKPNRPSAGATQQIQRLCNKLEIDSGRVFKSLGTLGGGNHFIEVGEDPMGYYWFTVHSGSRNFGLKTAEYHQDKAKKFIEDSHIRGIPRGLEYLPMEYGGREYLTDMGTAQYFADLNREFMALEIFRFFDLEADHHNHKSIKSVHNYIDFNDSIVRKGAISANQGEQCVIPFNMRDGIAVCRGKGSKKWNNSAPHGAGRIMSRSKAKQELTLDEYITTMKGIWSSCVHQSTLDEAPMAYKDMNEIIEFMTETVEVLYLIKPVYNFKAS